jgi:hypothetical protein
MRAIRSASSSHQISHYTTWQPVNLQNTEVFHVEKNNYVSPRLNK